MLERIITEAYSLSFKLTTSQFRAEDLNVVEFLLEDIDMVELK